MYLRTVASAQAIRSISEEAAAWKMQRTSCYTGSGDVSGSPGKIETARYRNLPNMRDDPVGDNVVLTLVTLYSVCCEAG